MKSKVLSLRKIKRFNRRMARLDKDRAEGKVPPWDGSCEVFIILPPIRIVFTVEE